MEKIVPLRSKLNSGDTIEILVSKNQTPSKDWLNIVQSSRARTKIKQWLLKTSRDKYAEISEEILDKNLKVFNSSLKKIESNGDLEQLIQVYKLPSLRELHSRIGSGRISIESVLSNIPSIEKDQKSEISGKIKSIKDYSENTLSIIKNRSKGYKNNPIIVDSHDDVLVKMAKCCNPIPGDNIIGYITQAHGITIHLSVCKRFNQGNVHRFIEVQWNPNFNFNSPVKIKVISSDNPGVLSKISNMITKEKINIKSAFAQSLPDKKGKFIFEIEVKNHSELIHIINKIEGLDDIISAVRI